LTAGAQKCVVFGPVGDLTQFLIHLVTADMLVFSRGYFVNIIYINK